VTQVVEPAAPRTSPGGPRPGRGDERAGRWPVVIVLILALACCGLTGSWASSWKDHNTGDHPVAAQRGALGGMNSYSLALMLGGLRGPLVMVLWSKVEGQKIDRDLEDVDTMIEWIRLLQPEFDTVHIFQIWNKAYNISAMMASSASKYTTILDAVDYARRVEAEKPGDLNILDQLARVLGEKLGGQNVQERGFYRKQFMEDSLTDASRRKAYPEDDATYRRMGVKFFESKNGPLLTNTNELDPRLVTVRYPRPTDLPANSEWNTGAEFQYLEKYQPFPLGIPPMAVGYNYAKRSQVAMTVGGQKPLQLSDTVIDTYPGILLKQWSEFELDRAVGYEGRAFGIRSDKPIPGFVAARASPPAAPVASPRDMQDAVYGYGMCARLSEDALNEYERHLSNPQFVNPYMSYASQLIELRAQHALAAADYVYAQSFLPGADRAALFSQAQGIYRDALTRYERIVMTYCMEPVVRQRLFAKGTIVDLDKLSDEQVDRLYAAYVAAVLSTPPPDREYDDQRVEYGVSVNRAQTRLQQLSAFGQRSILQTH
jgi:hypothetical protein